MKRLEFFKGLSLMFTVFDASKEAYITGLKREEAGEKLSNREWAALIISSIGVEAASTALSGIIGTVIANVIAPGLPIANTIIGSVFGSIIGYIASKKFKPEELKRRLEDQLVKLFDQLFDKPEDIPGAYQNASGFYYDGTPVMST